jgi:hypothetical protein
MMFGPFTAWLSRKMHTGPVEYDKPEALTIQGARFENGFAMVLQAGPHEIAVLLPKAQALQLADQILTAFTEGVAQ